LYYVVIQISEVKLQLVISCHCHTKLAQLACQTQYLWREDCVVTLFVDHKVGNGHLVSAIFVAESRNGWTHRSLRSFRRMIHYARNEELDTRAQVGTRDFLGLRQ